MTTKEKGDIYEEYVCQYINTRALAWLWKNAPEKHLLLSGLINDQNKYRLHRKNPRKYSNP
jgi:hypothetical protein